jgi:hypothetical protein
MSIESMLLLLLTLLLYPLSSSELSVSLLLLAELLDSLNLYISELATLLDLSESSINSLSSVKTNKSYKDSE